MTYPRHLIIRDYIQYAARQAFLYTAIAPLVFVAIAAALLDMPRLHEKALDGIDVVGDWVEGE